MRVGILDTDEGELRGSRVRSRNDRRLLRVRRLDCRDRRRATVIVGDVGSGLEGDDLARRVHEEEVADRTKGGELDLRLIMDHRLREEREVLLGELARGVAVEAKARDRKLTELNLRRLQRRKEALAKLGALVLGASAALSDSEPRSRW